MGVKLKEAMGDGMRVDKWCLLFHPLRMILCFIWSVTSGKKLYIGKMQIGYRLRYAQLITSFPWTLRNTRSLGL